MGNSKERHIGCEGLVTAERFLPLLFRRTTGALYRRSSRYHAYLERVEPKAALPVPAIVESLTVYLSQVLPAALVRRLGTRGLFRLARVLDRALRVIPCCVRLVYHAVRPIRRRWPRK